MAAVCDMPDVTWQESDGLLVASSFLEPVFSVQKAASKPQKDAFYAILRYQINIFPWSDPELDFPTPAITPLRLSALSCAGSNNIPGLSRIHVETTLLGR